MKYYPPQDEEYDDDLPEYTGPSKSQRKRDMHALQAMGEELAALSSDRLKKIKLPETLLGALLEWQRLKKHEARRRQMQYIGKLMRDVEPEPIRAVLDEINGVSAEATARLHRLERLREQILADEKVLADVLEEFPEADVQHLRQLRRNALKEQELSKPPKAFREIFRILKELEAAQREATSSQAEDEERDEA